MNITDYEPATLDFGAMYEDHFAGHHPEDGYELLAQVYFVTATAPDGSRWKRYVGTYGWVTGYDDECGEPLCYQQTFHNGRELGITREQMEHGADIMAKRLQDSPSPKLNADMWEEWVPVYGSDQYIRGYWEERTAFDETRST